MAGEIDLNKLLASMSPELLDGEYVFCSFQNAQYGDLPELEPFASCIEAEGLTLVIPRARADNKGLGYNSTYKRHNLKSAFEPRRCWLDCSRRRKTDRLRNKRKRDCGVFS